MYREIQRARDSMDTVHGPLQSAILSDDTREMTQYAGQAQMAANNVLRQVEEALRNQDSRQSGGIRESRVERSLVDAAAASLSKAVVDGERVAMGTSVSEIREALLGVKTRVDFAHAYLEAALGGEIE